ncbi:ParA family protein [Paludicola sp. MB14-C6]|uniref:ParA family protein n=1 Tax=Paludihabitans sp. MB14-C6 TaxID=3070656 RepID=UPI0027DD041F|nr:ParA family protein [Paludicola sp. MB14-C6]WMJ22712.1 ParA family protein [Paludicola sp. MB14-C6]
MSKIIAIVNQKGGVGKTITALNISAGLAKVGMKVLAIDLDPQGNLSDYLGYVPDGKPTISEVIFQEVSGVRTDSFDFIRRNSEEKIDYIPANKLLAGMVSILGSDNDSQEVIKRILSREPFTSYDYIILDCKPSLDLLVCNALATSNSLVIPVQAELFSYNAVAEVMQTIAKMKSSANPDLNIAGILVTMFRKQTSLSNEVLEALNESYPGLVFDNQISFLSEAGKSTCTHSSLINLKGSRIGQEYLSVVEQLIAKDGANNG